MSRKGVVRLRLQREEAAVTAAVIRERIPGARLTRTPFEALPRFGQKLEAALRRKRRGQVDGPIELWTVTPEEAEAAYHYLMLFSAWDVPQFLTNGEMDAVHHCAIDIAWGLVATRGKKQLDFEEVDLRIQAWQEPETTTIKIPNDRWVRRLRKRKVRTEVESRELAEAVKKPTRRTPKRFLTLLKRRRNTRN